MKKNLSIFSFLLCFLLLTTSTFAIDPVIIKKAKPGHQPLKNPMPDDPIYYSQDIGGIDTVRCAGTYGISQSFEPEEETVTDAEGNTTTSYVPYDVNQIAGAFLPVQEKWTNLGLDDYRRHLASRQKAIAGSLANIKKGFLSLNPDKGIGASNASRRSTPNRILRCQKGQRLVKAVQLLGGQSGDVADEQVAWDCGGNNFQTVVDQEKNPCGGQPIWLSDIALSMDTNPFLDLGSTDPSGACSVGTTQTYVFYDPLANCNIAPTDPAAPTPGPLANFGAGGTPLHPIAPEYACMLYRSTVEAADIGSSPRKFKTWSLDHDQPVDIETKISNGPWLQAFPYSSGKSSISYLIKPQKDTIEPQDICATGKQDRSRNKPNPLNFFVYAIEFFGQIIDTAQSFGKTMHYEVYIDKTVQDGISADESSLKGVIPAKEQEKYFNGVRPVSSTDKLGKTVDPGNPYTRSVFAKQLLPKSWQ